MTVFMLFVWGSVIIETLNEYALAGNLAPSLTAPLAIFMIGRISDSLRSLYIGKKGLIPKIPIGRLRGRSEFVRVKRLNHLKILGFIAYLRRRLNRLTHSWVR